MIDGHTGNTRAPRRGRPRTEGLDERVLAATREVVTRDGYGAATIDEIARVAGVSKGSIYRRWPTKGVLVYQACVVNDDALAALVDSGDVADDLVEIAMMTARGQRSGAQHDVLRQVFADAARDPQLATLLRERFFAPRSEAIAERARRAIGRGELRADLDPALVPAIINGAQQYWRTVWDRPMTDAEVRALVGVIVGSQERR